jgi:hypothetical protein
VLARLAASERADEIIDRVSTALTPVARPTGVKFVIPALQWPTVHVSSVVSLTGAVAFCALIGGLLVTVSATAPALGLPSIARPTLAMNSLEPIPLEAVLEPPSASPVVASADATPASEPRAAASAAKHVGFVGSLLVESDPVGATVFVNRERVGETPLRLPEMAAGSRVIWVESEGYQRWSAGVLVPADKLTRLNVKLTRDPRQ